MRISDWSSDVCSSDLAGLVVVTINTAGAEGVEARPRVDLVCQVARSVDHGERASVVVNERASEQAVVFAAHDADVVVARRSEEHTSELQSLMRNSYAVFCLQKKTYTIYTYTNKHHDN